VAVPLTICPWALALQDSMVDTVTDTDLDGLVACTTCSRPFLDHRPPARHIELGVLLCQRCLDGIASVTLKADADGWHETCTWCHLGGELICCDTCPRTFCMRCVEANLGQIEAETVAILDKWRCYICRPNIPALVRLQKECDRVVSTYMPGQRVGLQLQQNGSRKWKCPVAWCNSTLATHGGCLSHLRSSSVHRPALLFLPMLLKQSALERETVTSTDASREMVDIAAAGEHCKAFGLTNEAEAVTAAAAAVATAASGESVAAYGGPAAAATTARLGRTKAAAVKRAREVFANATKTTASTPPNKTSLAGTFSNPLLACPKDGCSNTYTSKGGLQYHLKHGHKPVVAGKHAVGAGHDGTAKRSRRGKRPPSGDVPEIQCPVAGCGFKFASRNEQTHHMQQQHPSDPVPVKVKLETPLNKAKIGPPFVCTEPGCERVFTTPGGLLYHTTGHRERVKIACPRGCGKEFVSVLGLQYHEKHVNNCVAAAAYRATALARKEEKKQAKICKLSTPGACYSLRSNTRNIFHRHESPPCCRSLCCIPATRFTCLDRYTTELR